jgi:hypothetical protein
MLLSAVSVLVNVLQSPEIPEGLMNNPVLFTFTGVGSDLHEHILWPAKVGFSYSSHIVMPTKEIFALWASY